MDENCHEKGQSVTPPSDVAVAEEWAEILERAEARRAGLSRADARPIVARKTGVPEGKLYSLARRRLKAIQSDVLKRIGASLVRELQAELARVEHDLHILTQIGERADSGETLSLAASRQKILEALGLNSSSPAQPDQGEG